MGNGLKGGWFEALLLRHVSMISISKLWTFVWQSIPLLKKVVVAQWPTYCLSSRGSWFVEFLCEMWFEINHKLCGERKPSWMNCGTGPLFVKEGLCHVTSSLCWMMILLTLKEYMTINLRPEEGSQPLQNVSTSQSALGKCGGLWPRGVSCPAVVMGIVFVCPPRTRALV